MEHRTNNPKSVADVETGVAASAATDPLHTGEIVSFNTPKLDVRERSQKVVATQANICSKTCNSH